MWLSLGIIVNIGLSMSVLFLLVRLRGQTKLPGFDVLETQIAGMERTMQRVDDQFRQNREELALQLQRTSNDLLQRLSEHAQQATKQFESFDVQMNNHLKLRFEALTTEQKQLITSNEQKLDKVRETLEIKLTQLQQENSVKLEEMRKTVDEKLQKTLDERLGESFKLVNDRLEQVYKGLGEMQTLAVGVGDLKKVLSNVKTRGILGEYQLENILEQLLAPEQYVKNSRIRPDSLTMVDFAVKIPSRDEPDQAVLIPIDAKFPTEDYQQLMEAYETGALELIEEKRKALVNRIKAFAKDIKEKYVHPPHSTDFAIMFLPFEGLYAEVLRNAGLFETVQRDYKVTITGPTTISAILNSLQMGFRTLAIEKRTSEVWDLLGAVKGEFNKFSEVLKKTQDRLNQASSELDTLVGVRTRKIQSKLKSIQELSVDSATALITSAEEIEEMELA